MAEGDTDTQPSLTTGGKFTGLSQIGRVSNLVVKEKVKEVGGGASCGGGRNILT